MSAAAPRRGALEEHKPAARRCRGTGVGAVHTLPPPNPHTAVVRSTAEHIRAHRHAGRAREEPPDAHAAPAPLAPSVVDRHLAGAPDVRGHEDEVDGVAALETGAAPFGIPAEHAAGGRDLRSALNF